MIAQPRNVDKRPQSMLSFFSFSWFSFSCGFVLKFFFHGVFVVRPYGYALLVTERVWNREPRSHDRLKNKMAVYLKIR